MQLRVGNGHSRPKRVALPPHLWIATHSVSLAAKVEAGGDLDARLSPI